MKFVDPDGNSPDCFILEGISVGTIVGAAVVVGTAGYFTYKYTTDSRFRNAAGNFFPGLANNVKDNITTAVKIGKILANHVLHSEGDGASDSDNQDAKSRGRESEKRVLQDLGQDKNNDKVSSDEGNSVPDILNGNEVGEIKDTKRVSDTKQIRIQRDAANKSGREHKIYTGDKTKVSKRVLDQSKVIRRPDLGPK